MCGIAGLVGDYSESHTEIVSRMVRTLRHRGPDASGILKLGRSGVLGHARLSIVDLTNGRQPMECPDRSLAVTFNGEIYGYQGIKNELSYRFLTESDTELILALYLNYGVEMLKKLPGMFSFALWDSSLKRLFCARDRFGEKPFFYAFGSDGSFIFASEIKALLASGLVRPRLSKSALAHYLCKGYVHPSSTIYENIHALPPGSFLLLSDGQVRIETYWNPPERNLDLTLEAAAEEFRVLLDKSVEKQLVADVPVAGFLSAGLDSTTIMAIAARHSPSIKAFTFDFGAYSSEAETAEKTAKTYGLNLERIRIEQDSPLEILDKCVSIYDEPFADSSMVPTYLICQAASNFTKVALTGDGGDELLGGYGCYLPMLEFDSKRTLLKFEQHIFLFAKLLWKIRLRHQAKKLFSWRDENRHFIGIDSCWKFLAESRSFFSACAVADLLNVDIGLAEHPMPQNAAKDSLGTALNYDISTWMAGDILVKTDRASMANGLELRAPFLDKEFAEFSLALPSAFKLADGRTKIVLRKAFESVWIEEVACGQKRGFESPIADWLRRPDFQQAVSQHLLDKRSKIYNWLDYDATIPHLKGTSLQILNLLVLALWFDRKHL